MNEPTLAVTMSAQKWYNSPMLPRRWSLTSDGTTDGDGGKVGVVGVRGLGMTAKLKLRDEGVWRGCDEGGYSEKVHRQRTDKSTVHERIYLSAFPTSRSKT